MSRSGYTDEDCDDNWAIIRWRGAVKAGIRGRRGQQALREILAALDAMPEKVLVDGSLVTPEGDFCTLGVLGAARGIDMENIDPDDRDAVAHAFGISEALAAEIMYENDEHIANDQWVVVETCGPMRPNYPEWGQHRRSVRFPNKDAPALRWQHMRNWVASNIVALDTKKEKD